MILVSKLAVTAVTLVALAGAVVARDGIITVKVHSKDDSGSNVRLYAPGVLVPIALRFTPREHLAEAAREMRPWLPTIRAAAKALRETDDATFVQVDDAEQHVVIRKDGGSIVVDVDDSEETVHVSLPIRLVPEVMAQLQDQDKRAL
jgi:hypothetical protein